MRPELVKIGPLTVYSYGFMLGLAFLAGSLLAAREADRKGLDRERFFDFLLLTLVVAVIVSRLFHVAFRLSEYMAAPATILNIRDGGLAIHGGLLGGVLTALWFARRQKTSFWRLADTLSPSLTIGISIARWGCLLAGCCYGVLCTLPWAVQTRFAPGWRHPTQIYESVLDLAIFGFLWWYRTRRKHDGQVFLAFLGLYSVVRFGVEFYREVDVRIGALTAAQVGSVALALVSLAVWAWMQRRPAVVEYQPEPAAAPPDLPEQPVPPMVSSAPPA
ncbi:MAG: prolipoprotein diacylglyceryl transferase [Bacillota bacterium]|nr:prolipoprotein diacylglyceryl transferase [Bacillota bacterium]